MLPNLIDPWTLKSMSGYPVLLTFCGPPTHFLRCRQNKMNYYYLYTLFIIASSRYMPLDSLMVWKNSICHATDCYFCLRIKSFIKKRLKWNYSPVSSMNLCSQTKNRIYQHFPCKNEEHGFLAKGVSQVLLKNYTQRITKFFIAMTCQVCSKSSSTKFVIKASGGCVSKPTKKS